MRFKVDENLHVEIAALLRERGHDALTVFDQGHRGRSDRDIANLTQSELCELVGSDQGKYLSLRDDSAKKGALFRLRASISASKLQQ